MRWRNLTYWGAVGLFVEIGIAQLGFWIHLDLTSNLQGPDFFSYYAISLLLLKRGPSAVYDLGAQKHFQDLVTAQWQGQFILLPHLLPPWVTLLFYPLALLPFRAAYVLWGVSILVLVGAAIALLVRASGLRGRAALLAATGAASSLPVLVLLVQGQSDAPMVLFLAATALFWARGREAGAGVAAALALFKPQLMLLVPVLFLVRRSWRALAAFVAVCVGLVALSLLTFGLQACLNWVGILAPWAFGGHAGYPVDAQSHYSLRGLLEPLPLSTSLQLAVLGVGLLALAAVLLRNRADPRLELALAVCGSFALSPYQHAHDLTLLIVPGLLLAGALPTLRHPRIGAALLLGGWVALELLIYAPPITALAIVALTLYLAWECWQGRPAPASEPNVLPIAA
jgi:hypothetical protein